MTRASKLLGRHPTEELNSFCLRGLQQQSFNTDTQSHYRLHRFHKMALEELNKHVGTAKDEKETSPPIHLPFDKAGRASIGVWNLWLLGLGLFGPNQHVSCTWKTTLTALKSRHALVSHVSCKNFVTLAAQTLKQ